MSFERRKNCTGLFYTRSKRTNGKLTREYIGTGEKAMAAYFEDQAKRAERRAARDERDAAEEEIGGLSPGTLEDDSETLLSASLASKGVFKHRREWR